MLVVSIEFLHQKVYHIVKATVYVIYLSLTSKQELGSFKSQIGCRAS